MMPDLLHWPAAVVILTLAGGVSRPCVAQMPPTRVAVAPVVERELPESIRLVGTVQPWRKATIAAQVAGAVAEFGASEGDFVETDTVICQLDPTVATIQLAAAKARLAALKAELDEQVNGTRKEVLDQLKAAVGEAQAKLDQWTFERKRVTELYEQNQSSAKEKHDTEMEYLAAQRRLAQAQARYQEALKGPRPEVIEQYRYKVAEQEQTVRRLQRDLDKTAVRAPFDGFVVAKQSEVGEWVAVGGPVADMVSIETVRVRADVPERAIQFATAGSPASVESPALGQRHSARVSRVIPLGDESARTFPVEIDLSNANHHWLPGMFVWVHVAAGPAAKRLMVPADAIVARGQATQVFVVRAMPDGKHMATPVPVTTGLAADGAVQISGPGIRPGDQVVVRANERLYGPGPVIPVPLGALSPEKRQASGDTGESSAAVSPDEPSARDHSP